MAKQKPFITEEQWIRLEPSGGQNLRLQPKMDKAQRQQGGV